jgi:hypothetical protein
MDNNSVSVRAYLANGDLHEVLENVSPREALTKYFLPDSPAPVQELIVKVRTRDGRLVSLYITPDRIEAATIGFPERTKQSNTTIPR